MRIFQVSPHFPPRSIGGVEIYVKRLSDALRALGDEPQVAALENVALRGSDVRTQIDTQFGYPVHRLEASLTERTHSLGMIHDHPGLERAVTKILEASAPNVIHLHSGYLLGAPVLRAAARLGIPIVVTLHDFWFICPRITLMHPGGALCSGPDTAAKCTWCLSTEKRRARLPDRLTAGLAGRAMVALLQQPLAAAALGKAGAVRDVEARRDTLASLLAGADLILSPSHFLREQTASAGVEIDRIHISRYGIETSAVKQSRPPSGSTLRVAYLGQLAPHKGVHLLIEAVRQLPTPNLAVRVFGDPAPHPRYAQRLRQLAGHDPRITFPGPYRHHDVYDILTETDTIVVPSVWYENSPFVIQEAQAAGVPVVASRLGGMRELVAHEVNGLLFEPGSAAALAAGIRRLAEDRAFVGRLRPDPGIVRTAVHEIEELREHYRRLSGTPRRAKSRN